MTRTKPNSQGRKTVAHRKRMLERKPDMPRRGADGNLAANDARSSRPMNRAARRSEFPVSRGGMNQESRRHKPARKE